MLPRRPRRPFLEVFSFKGAVTVIFGAQVSYEHLGQFNISAAPLRSKRLCIFNGH
jgi:hypothetical protein